VLKGCRHPSRSQALRYTLDWSAIRGRCCLGPWTRSTINRSQNFLISFHSTVCLLGSLQYEAYYNTPLNCSTSKCQTLCSKPKPSRTAQHCTSKYTLQGSLTHPHRDKTTCWSLLAGRMNYLETMKIATTYFQVWHSVLRLSWCLCTFSYFLVC